MLRGLEDGEFKGIFLDYLKQQATGETIEKLLKLAEVTPVSIFLNIIKKQRLQFCVVI
ncbi:unnamed protein product, partial [Urochloa humidicola]